GSSRSLAVAIDDVPRYPHLPNANPYGGASSVAAPLMVTMGVASAFAPASKTSTPSSVLTNTLPSSSTATPVARTSGGGTMVLIGPAEPSEMGAYTLMNPSSAT